MGVTCFTQEFACPVHPARMYKALILDSHNLFPKIMPHAFKSVEFVHGDGGVGTIKQIHFTEGVHFKHMKHRIDVLDKEKFVCKYTVIEGDVLKDKIESISYEVKFEKSAHGGWVCKMTTEYHTTGEYEMNEEEIKFGKEKDMSIYKATEAYLLENPDAYAA